MIGALIVLLVLFVILISATILFAAADNDWAWGFGIGAVICFLQLIDGVDKVVGS